VSLVSRAELSVGGRTRWGLSFDGARVDAETAIRITAGQNFSLELGWRSSESNSFASDLEKQRLAVARLNVGRFGIEYSNDMFPWGGGSDQGDTAAVSLSARFNEPALGGSFRLESLSLNLRMATGIPQRLPVTNPLLKIIAPDAGDPDPRFVTSEG